MRGLLLFALSFANLNDIWSPDVIPNALLSWTLLREGDVDYDEFTYPIGLPPPSELLGPIPGLMDLDREAYFFRACGASTATEPPKAARSAGGPPAPGPNDRVCSIFPPGMALLALPFFAPLVLGGVSPNDLALLVRGGHVVAATVETVATLLLWAVLARFVSARWALALVLLYALGTSVRTVASQALWQHAGVHLAVASSLWLVLRHEAVPLAREAAAGLLLGLGAVVRQTTALVAPGIAGGRPRATIAALAGAAIGALPLLVWGQVAFGNAFEQGYGAKPFDTPVPLGLYGLLLSPSRGLLVYAPYLAFALAALALAWRREGEVARRLRGLSLVWLATLVLYATYAEWWGGRVFGARFLDDLAPVLFAALAWGIGGGLLARRQALVAFWACAAWSLLLFQAAAFAYSNERWDMRPLNVNDAPQRIFEWSDPQWLAVLADSVAGGPRVLVAAILTAAIVLLLLRSERDRLERVTSGFAARSESTSPEPQRGDAAKPQRRAD